jgi:hypothetical protein
MVTIENTQSGILLRCARRAVVRVLFGACFTLAIGIVILVMMVILVHGDINSKTMSFSQRIAGAVTGVISGSILGGACVMIGLKRTYVILPLYRNSITIDKMSSTVVLSNKQVYPFSHFCSVNIVRKSRTEWSDGTFEISLTPCSNPLRKFIIIPSDIGIDSYLFSKSIVSDIATAIGIPTESSEPED